MKSALAKPLNGDLLGWTDDVATEEFHWLDLMVRYKFDHYQGFGPGRRFYVSLLRWLTQFKPEDRQIAYRLLREHVVYIGQQEMMHLVSLAGPKIAAAMRHHVARLMGLPVYQVDERVDAQHRLQLLRVRTLYVGVSDGARIDAFRRFNEGDISNEQVVAMAEISDNKWKSLHDKLAGRLNKLAKNQGRPAFAECDVTFEWVCLIDDFTGSGFSSIRWDEKANSWDGKVGKFVNENAQRKRFRLAENACIQVHHYLATAQAKSSIQERCVRIAKNFNELRFVASFGYTLLESARLQNCVDHEILELLNRHYDDSIEDPHKGSNLHFGYQECGLALVLEHNTPNNSVPLLWATSKRAKDAQDLSRPRWVPLFPRRERHSDTA
jgi:hypothetical protein